MKKLVGFLFVLLPFAVHGEEIQPCVGEDCFVDRVTYEIMDKEGNVIDRTVYDRLVPLNFTDAMALKYVRMTRNVEGGAKSFIEILKMGGAVEVLNADLEQP